MSYRHIDEALDTLVHNLHLHAFRFGRAICDWYERRLTGWSKEEMAQHEKDFH